MGYAIHEKCTFTDNDASPRKKNTLPISNHRILVLQINIYSYNENLKKIKHYFLSGSIVLYIEYEYC